MASFMKYLDRTKQLRHHVHNEFYSPPGWMYHHIMMGPLEPQLPRRTAKPPELIVPSDVILKAVVTKIKEFKDFQWAPLNGNENTSVDKFYVHPARRVAFLVEKYLTVDKVSFERALQLAYAQLQEERKDLDMQASLAKQDAAQAGVQDGGWNGYLQKSADSYLAVLQRRDAYGKEMRMKRFVEICGKKMSAGAESTLTLEDFADVFDQEEMRQLFIDYPQYRRLFPKQWYLIPPLPERSMSEWPPVSQKPEDPEHESKLEAVLNTVGRDSVDDARLSIMREFYNMVEFVDQQRDAASIQMDIHNNEGSDATETFKHWVKYRNNAHELADAEKRQQKKKVLGSVEDVDIYDPMYWTGPPTSLLIDPQQLTEEERKQYELLKIKGREMAYQIEKEFKPRSPQFLSEHDALYGKEAPVPYLPPRMIPPQSDEDIMAFSPKYIREYFPEAFREAVKINKKRMGEFQKEANLGPTDRPYAGLWRMVKKREADKTGGDFSAHMFKVPDWECSVQFDPESYKTLKLKLKGIAPTRKSATGIVTANPGAKKAAPKPKARDEDADDGRDE